MLRTAPYREFTTIVSPHLVLPMVYTGTVLDGTVVAGHQVLLLNDRSIAMAESFVRMSSRDKVPRHREQTTLVEARYRCDNDWEVSLTMQHFQSPSVVSILKGALVRSSGPGSD